MFTSTLRWFLFAMILANIASEMVFSFLSVYLAELGATVAQVGLVFSVAALVPLALQIVGGWLSDSIGRLRTIALGSLGGWIGYVGLVFAPTWEWALVALCFEYISGALVGPSFGAYIAEQSAEENRGRVYGFAQGIFMIVAVLGPLLAGFLAQWFGFRAMLCVAALLYASATGLRVWMARAAQFAAKTTHDTLTFAGFRAKLTTMFALLIGGGVLTWIFLTDGVRDIAFQLAGNLYPLYLDQIAGMSIEQIGWLRALRGIVIMTAMMPAGWLSDKRGERVVIAAGFFLQALGFAIFIQANSLSSFALAEIIFGLGVGAVTPTYNALVSKVVPEKMRGMAFGLFHTSLGVISLPAPWLGAQLWERVSPQFPFMLVAFASLISIVPVWFKFVAPKSEQTQPGLVP